MSRAAQRRQCNAANRRIALAASAAAGIATNGPAPELVCGACGAKVFTLVAGQCFRCGRPAEGKNLHDMTAEQYGEIHTCGLPNKYHCDGFDGNWLDCDEANLRRGYLNTKKDTQ